MEMLEHRLVLSTFWVTNTADTGTGSLRDAILGANANAGPDTIGFNIPTSDANFVDVDSALPGGDLDKDAFVITPLSALPALNDASGGTTIDGSTQTAFTGDTNPFGPEIVLDGSAITVAASGLHLASDNNQVHGLNIRNFTYPFNQGGVLITGDANIVSGSFIGTNATGTEVARNHTGIYIQDASANLIGGTAVGAGNVISGNSLSIYITGDTSTGNVIQGNRIGTDRTGSTVLSNGWDTGTNNDGIIIDAGSNNLIGGTAPGAGNLISGFWEQGIWIRGSATGNLMQGNRIGTNADGTERLYFEDRGHSSIRGILIQDTTNNVVGAGNVVTGNFLGLVIEGAGATGNVVRGSLVGTDPTGTIPVGNTRDGIRIHQGASNNLIGGTTAADRNILSGNGWHGVYIYGEGTSNNRVQGNYIGTTADGLAPLGNLQEGIDIYGATDNLIGGGAPGAGNLISGNVGHGVVIQFQTATGNRVQGNFIGTDKTGSAGLPNDYVGVDLFLGASANIIGIDGDGVDDGNERNIIAGNGTHGVHIWGSSHNTVAGNWIGVGLDGAPLGNAGDGIRFAGGSHFNRVGTNGDGVSDALERNVISANSGNGIHSPSAWGVNNDNIIAGNYIGTDVTGTAAMGNGGDGIWLADSSGTLIGSTGVAEGNTIAFNTGTGLAVTGAIGAGNSIRGNSIHSNGGLGIDLGGDGVTPNDTGDGDSGPNSLQNFPTLEVVEGGATTRVAGTLNSTPNATFTIDFYANAAQDPSGFGEGERWLGSIIVDTDSSGNTEFDVPLAASTAPGEFVSATASDAGGDTSEFSGGMEIQYLSVQIDVKPGSDTNPVNLVENGVIPVAILTTDSFDASWVNASTVVFAGARAVHSALEDTDGDGDLDLILHFEIQETNLADIYAQLLAEDINEDGVLDSNRQSAAVSLTGQTATDEYFQGFDDVDLFLSGKNLRDFLEDLAAAGAI